MGDFTARDLSQVLPDEGPSASKPKVVFEAPKPRIDKDKKVTRYRPGQAPQWAKDEEQDEFLLKKDATARTARSAKPQKKISIATGRERGRRVQDAEVLEEDSDSDGGARARRRRARRGSSSGEEMEIVEEEDDDEVAARRARARARAASSDDEEEMEVLEEEEEEAPKPEGGSGESSSEWETDTDAEEYEDSTPMAKPVFRSKAQRLTVLEAERKAEEEAKKQHKLQEKNAARAVETRVIVADEIRRAEEADALAEEGSDNDKPDDSDDSDDPDEFQAWQLRELKRMKRDKDAREAADKERAETERRRKLTAEERAKEDAELEKQGLKVFKKDKENRKFLQKWHHKGVYYMDEDSIKDKDDVRLRSNAGATGDDLFDRSAMPKVMQKRNFGKMSQTKYTHLAAEDTSTKDTAWSDRHNPLAAKMASRLGGVHGDLDTAGKIVRGRRKAAIEASKSSRR